MATKPQKIFKVVVIGAAGVGKTSIIRRFCENSFLEGYKTTIGSDFYVKKLDLARALVNFSVWDLAGEERFKFVLPTFCKGAQGALVVFDLSRRRSYINVTSFIELLWNITGQIPAILIGNKSDLVDQRSVTPDEAKEYGTQCKMVYFETSAKDNINIYKIFENLGNLMIDYTSTH
ncbi:MAG: GTP-binding protein [Candidatus Helarchaeota archaeon]|nr:GTP-binding protein [Candidatus Helarchaeota archaeon]